MYRLRWVDEVTKPYFTYIICILFYDQTQYVLRKNGLCVFTTDISKATRLDLNDIPFILNYFSNQYLLGELCILPELNYGKTSTSQN